MFFSLSFLAGVFLLGGVPLAAAPASKTKGAKSSTSKRKAPQQGRLRLLILGGGRSRVAALRWRRQNAVKLARLKRALRWSQGYPKIIQSKTVRGLRPGFHIVIAGYCSRKRYRAALSVLKAFYPGSYARKVSVSSGQLSCPQVRSYYVWTNGARVWAQPGKTKKALARLSWDEEVYFLGKISKKKSKKRWGCRTFHQPWYWVARRWGRHAGWVHGGALRPGPGNRFAQTGLALSYHPEPHKASEDWGWFSNKVQNALEKDGVLFPNDYRNTCLIVGKEKKPTFLFDVKGYLPNKAGYLLWRKGTRPLFVQHAMPHGVLSQAYAYFNPTLQRPPVRP